VSARRKQPEGRPPAFTYRPSKKETRLYCEGASLSHLAEEFGTPLYVYSASTLRQRVRDFDRAFRGVPHTICYSVKANSNLSLLKLLAGDGCGFDVVSGGELQRVLAANKRAATKIVFSGVGKTADEMMAALKADTLLFNVESESELSVLARCAGNLKRKARIALRVNPDVPANTHPYIATGLHQHKFGVPIAQAREIYRRAASMKWLQVAGVSVHIGSQITDVEPFALAMERVAELVGQLRGDGHAIEFVDAGGGLGICYDGGDAGNFPQRASEYAKALIRPLRSLKIHLLLEPGRSLIGPAGTLVTRVLYRKENNSKKFLVVDAAMNDLLRPSLYNAFHEIVPVRVDRGTTHEKVDVVGPICETGDFFARDRELPDTAEGDLLAILDAGAYGMALASNYNTRPRAAEVLVTGRAVKLIRRRERLSDMLCAERPT
jgi:diaminopimelate decarboxylase